MGRFCSSVCVIARHGKMNFWFFHGSGSSERRYAKSCWYVCSCKVTPTINALSICSDSAAAWSSHRFRMNGPFARHILRAWRAECFDLDSPVIIRRVVQSMM
jgi:hypothetical protein